MGERKIERETGAGERKRKTGMRERKIARATGAGERDRKRDRVGESLRDRGEREGVTGKKRKNYKHKKFMEFYLVVDTDVGEKEDTGVGERGYRCGGERERHKHTQERERD